MKQIIDHIVFSNMNLKVNGNKEGRTQITEIVVIRRVAAAVVLFHSIKIICASPLAII